MYSLLPSAVFQIPHGAKIANYRAQRVFMLAGQTVFDELVPCEQQETEFIIFAVFIMICEFLLHRTVAALYDGWGDPD